MHLLFAQLNVRMVLEIKLFMLHNFVRLLLLRTATAKKTVTRCTTQNQQRVLPVCKVLKQLKKWKRGWFFSLDKRLVIVRIECTKLLEGDIKGLENCNILC